MNTYARRTTNPNRMNTYKIVALQVPCNEHLQKRGEGGGENYVAFRAGHCAGPAAPKPPILALWSLSFPAAGRVPAGRLAALANSDISDTITRSRAEQCESATKGRGENG